MLLVRALKRRSPHLAGFLVVSKTSVLNRASFSVPLSSNLL